MEFVTGFVVGFVIAAIIGRGKFLAVQNKLREIRYDLETKLNTERSLTDGLTQELAERMR